MFLLDDNLFNFVIVVLIFTPASYSLPDFFFSNYVGKEKVRQRGTMVSLRETIKRFALACWCKAQDRFPSRNHACAKRVIVPRRGTMVTLRVTIKGFALACLCFAQDCHPLGNHSHLGGQLCALRMHASAKRLIVSYAQLSCAYCLRLLWETMAEVSMRSQAAQAARAAYALKL